MRLADGTTTFTPYSLQMVLREYNRGIDVAGYTVDKDAGLFIYARTRGSQRAAPLDQLAEVVGC